jgi:hypothetical protein
MYVKRRVRLRIIWAFGWMNLIIFTLISSGAVLYCISIWSATGLRFPSLPVSLLGTATAFYTLVSRTTRAMIVYGKREGSGADMVNDSRSWAFSIRDY